MRRGSISIGSLLLLVTLSIPTGCRYVSPAMPHPTGLTKVASANRTTGHVGVGAEVLTFAIPNLDPSGEAVVAIPVVDDTIWVDGSVYSDIGAHTAGSIGLWIKLDSKRQDSHWAMRVGGGGGLGDQYGTTDYKMAFVTGSLHMQHVWGSIEGNPKRRFFTVNLGIDGGMPLNVQNVIGSYNEEYAELEERDGVPPFESLVIESPLMFNVETRWDFGLNETLGAFVTIKVSPVGVTRTRYHSYNSSGTVSPAQYSTGFLYGFANLAAGLSF